MIAARPAFTVVAAQTVDEGRADTVDVCRPVWREARAAPSATEHRHRDDRHRATAKEA